MTDKFKPEQEDIVKVSETMRYNDRLHRNPLNERTLLLRDALEHIARHYGSAEQCREIAQSALDRDIEKYT